MTVVKRLADSVYRAGVAIMAARRIPLTGVIMYHAITSGQADQLEEQLAYLLELFSIVPLSRIAKRIGSGDSWHRGEIALTFDDGLRNHYTAVYPILKRLGVPATFFVCPGLIGGKQWLWNQEARERLREMPETARTQLCHELQAPSAGIEDTVAWMKTLSPASRFGAERRIRAATPAFAPSEKQHEEFDIMSWEELQQLDPQLVTIGSHTVSHPILTELSDVEVDYEVKQSRFLLEERLGVPVRQFCYPNGAHDLRVIRAVREAYTAAVTTIPGALTNTADPCLLPRVAGTDNIARLLWQMGHSRA